MPTERVKVQVFRGDKSWEELFEAAANFASDLGRDRLINISHGEDIDDYVVAVFYWSDT
jgi:hypothetical protein